MSGTVTMKGKTLNLKGSLVKEGQIAPDCELTGADLTDTKLSTFKGKSLILMSVPSLDTSVCSKEARRFNLELEKHVNWLTGVCVSMDLPFAQSRWCAAEGIKNLKTFSDFKKHEFGEKYGVYIEEIGLLARAVFLIDSQMKVVHTHLVKEVTEEPDYSLILEQLQQMTARA